MIDPETLRLAFRGAALATEMAVVTVIGVVAGSWLDHRFGTEPGLTILLAVSGFSGGVALLLRQMRTNGDDETPPDPH
jgi:F0F1-type ATP synthase assembly protein I